MLQENAEKMLLFKFFHLKNKRKGIFEFLFGMLFTVLTATFSCLLMSPCMNRSVCEIISKHYIVNHLARKSLHEKTAKMEPKMLFFQYLAPVTQNQWVPISIEDLSCILFDLFLKIFRILHFKHLTYCKIKVSLETQNHQITDYRQL